MPKVSWMFNGKKYFGTLIPSRETKDNRFARTENGKIKKLPKKKTKATKGAPSKTKPADLDYTTKRGNKEFDRGGKRVKESRKPYTK